MRYLLSGGGTGGHVYPGLAVAKALNRECTQPVQLLWVGSANGAEAEWVSRSGVPFRGITAGGVHGLKFWRACLNVLHMIRGLAQAWSVVRSFKPSACLVTGGYISVPVALAAWIRRVPVLVYLPDVEPGQAVRLVSHFAHKVAVTAQASSSYFPPGKVVVTGYPIRAELENVDRSAARHMLELIPELPTLLVMGGSRGARSINCALTADLEDLLADCQIVHISGQLDAEWVARRGDELPETVRTRYHHHAYLHSRELASALAAADLVVARAGAATMGEFPAMGLPSILVPYPYYWRYQKVNADYLVSQGAAIQLEDERLDEDLTPAILHLLADEEKRSKMQERSRSLAQPGAATRIAGELIELGSSQGR